MLLWLLSELFEQLPEVGDPERPRLVLLFDEAHLLFDDAPEALLDKMAQVVRLIRSKGVGVYFSTQNPLDVPGAVLAQLGNRVQHALRAYTPQEQKALRAAARSFRENPALDPEAVIPQLGTGEALVSFLDPKGKPGMTERALILPPESRVGAVTDAEREAVLRTSRLAGRYDAPLDQGRESLTPGKTVYELISEGRETVTLGGREVNARAYCTRFNFHGADQQKKVDVLSGGERNRLHLARMLKSGANVLLLDEPTNDIDVNTMRALEDALDNFAGCVLVISHDRWFLDRVATHIMAFEDNAEVVFFEGNYTDYEDDRRKRLGKEADTPHRPKFRKLTR